MASRLVLHIGVQKSGTSFLQHGLATRQTDLTRMGIAYPLRHAQGSGVVNHERATYGLLCDELPWVEPRAADVQRRAWQRLQDEVRGVQGTVLLSAEALSVIRRPGAELLLDRLGVPDVQVVVTTRDLGSILPSFWQQSLRNGRATGLDGFLSRLAAERAAPASRRETDVELTFWRSIGYAGLVNRWSAVAGGDQVTVVTTPGRPPEILWRRFLDAVGASTLPGGMPEVSAAQRLAGLTEGEAALLLAVNVAASRCEVDPSTARRLRSRLLATFSSRTSDRGAKISLPPGWRGDVARWSAEDVEALGSTGARVVGDLEDLRYDGRDDGTAHGATAADVAAASAAAFVALQVRPTQQGGPVSVLAPSRLRRRSFPATR
jgi:hypothetical protein